MNSDEMAALAASIERALVDGLAANEAAREARAAAAERAQIEAEEARGLAEKRLRALNGVVRTVEREQELYASIVFDAIEMYCSEARRAVLGTLKNDPRMPRSINYLERYGALIRIQDRDEVLQKIESTLDLADRILADVGAVDVQAALTEAAGAYAKRVMGLEGVQVVEPADPSSRDSDDDELPSIDVTDRGINRIIDEAFSEAWGGQTMLEIQMTQQLESARDREEAINKQADRAKKAATKSARIACGRRARSVAGAVLAVDWPDPFDGTVGARLAKDPALVCALAAEVRTSFAAFTQVVQDNGLFAAFSNEGSYGACRGYHYDWWWSDLFYDECDDECCGGLPRRREYDNIPTMVKEGENGDSLEKSIDRMRAFNKQKYWGLLDDDFQEHVEAFWYGFKKLMENVNGLFEVDSRAFNTYCAQVSAQVKDRAADLAARMDGVQAQAFAQEISARAQEVRRSCLR